MLTSTGCTQGNNPQKNRHLRCKKKVSSQEATSVRDLRSDKADRLRSIRVGKLRQFHFVLTYPPCKASNQNRVEGALCYYSKTESASTHIGGFERY